MKFFVVALIAALAVAGASADATCTPVDLTAFNEELKKAEAFLDTIGGSVDQLTGAINQATGPLSGLLNIVKGLLDTLGALLGNLIEGLTGALKSLLGVANVDEIKATGVNKVRALVKQVADFAKAATCQEDVNRALEVLKTINVELSKTAGKLSTTVTALIAEIAGVAGKVSTAVQKVLTGLQTGNLFLIVSILS